MKETAKRIIVMIIAFIIATTVVAFGEPVGTTLNETQEVKTSKVDLLKVSSYNYSKIKLEWKGVSEADGYVIYRATSENGKYKKIVTITNSSKTTYINGSRITGKKYFYKIRAYKYINGVKVYTKYSQILSAYARPNKSVISDVKLQDKYITIKLKKISGATGYTLYKRQNYIWTKEKNVSKPIIKLKYEENTDYRVRAYKIVNGKKVYGLYSNVYYDFYLEEEIEDASGNMEKPNIEDEFEEDEFEEDEFELGKTEYFKLDCYSTFVKVGDTFTLKATIVPEQKLTWTSSNPAVASIDNDGNVTVNSTGRCNIRVVDRNGNDVYCSITAFSHTTESWIQENLTNSNNQIKARLVNGSFPEYYDDSKNEWSSNTVNISKGIKEGRDHYSTAIYYNFTSSDNKVVMVDENGEIKPVSEGKAIIKAIPSVPVQKWAKEYSFEIDVTTAETQKDIMLKIASPLKIDVNGNGGNINVYYADGTTANISYLGIVAESSDRKVCEVSVNGGNVKVTPLAEGTTTVTVKTKYNTSASCVIEVVDINKLRQEQIDNYMALTNESMTEYQKLKTLCEYILEEYDYKEGISSANTMFIYKGGDCWAYSAIVNYYCQQIGLESKTFNEIVQGNIWHTTNRVKADGKWYYVDCSINRGTTYDLYITNYQDN